jgi:hypothetical protein
LIYGVGAIGAVMILMGLVTASKERKGKADVSR